MDEYDEHIWALEYAEKQSKAGEMTTLGPSNMRAILRYIERLEAKYERAVATIYRYQGVATSVHGQDD